MAWGTAASAALPWAGKSLWQLMKPALKHPIQALKHPFRSAPPIQPGGIAGLPAGYLNPKAHTGRFLGAGAGTAASIPLLSMLGGGEEEQISPPMGMAPGPQAWSPPSGLPTATERAQSSIPSSQIGRAHV